MKSDCKLPTAENKGYRASFRITLSLCIALTLIVILHSNELASQTTNEEQAPGRGFLVDLTPFVGYRTSIIFPVTQNTQVLSPNLILEARPAYGVAIGLRTNEEDLVEFRWIRQDTHIHLEAVGSSNQKVVLNQFLGDFTHEYILDNWRTWARPFVMGSVGATQIDEGTISFTRFTFGLGGGVKFFFNRHLGVRMQAEWLPLVINPAVSAVCGGGCIVNINATIVSQGEVLVGPLFQF